MSVSRVRGCVIASLVVLIGSAAVAVGQIAQADRSSMGTTLSLFPIILLILPAVATLGWALRLRNWTSFLFSLLAAGIITKTAGFQFPERNPAPADLRVMSYNIQHGARGTGGLVVAIRKSDPDIAILQEGTMDWEPARVAVERFRAWFPGYEFVQHRDRMVLSKFPILKTESHWLGDREMKKIAQVVSVKYKGAPLNLVNIHMLPVGIHPGGIKATVEHRIREYDDLERVLDGLDGPIIMGGDFNGIARGPHYSRLTRRLTDVYSESGRGFGFTIPTELPMKRIDYIFASKELKALRAWVPNEDASDHRPVVAEFRF